MQRGVFRRLVRFDRRRAIQRALSTELSARHAPAARAGMRVWGGWGADMRWGLGGP